MYECFRRMHRVHALCNRTNNPETHTSHQQAKRGSSFLSAPPATGSRDAQSKTMREHADNASNRVMTGPEAEMSRRRVNALLSNPPLDVTYCYTFRFERSRLQHLSPSYMPSD